MISCICTLIGIAAAIILFAIALKKLREMRQK